MRYLITLLLIFNLVHGYDGTTQTIAADSVKTIHIELEGNIIIENSSDYRIHLRTESEIGGKVIGFTNRDELSDYRVATEIKDGELYLKPFPRKKSWAVGINTMVENNTHYIQIPKNMNVIVTSSRAHINSNGTFALIRINNDKGETELRIPKSQIHYLTSATSQGEIWVGNRQYNDFHVISEGQAVVDISSHSGMVKLMLN